MKEKHKRRNFFIKQEFQGKMILGYFLFVMGGCLLFILLFGIFSSDSLTISYTNNDFQFGQTPFMLIKKALAAHWILLVFGGALLVAAAMFLTHRIAGPLYRFEKALDQMISGNLNDTIYLREHDEGKELAGKINTFNASLSLSVDSIAADSVAIAALLKRLEELEQSPELLDTLKSVTWAIREYNNKISATCEKYRAKDA